MYETLLECEGHVLERALIIPLTGDCNLVLGVGECVLKRLLGVEHVGKLALEQERVAQRFVALERCCID